MKTKISKVLIIVFSWVLIAAILFFYAHNYLVISIPPDKIRGIYSPGFNFLGYVIPALLGGLFIGYNMVFRSYYKVRRKSFTYGILYNIVLFLIIYVAFVVLVTVPIAIIAEQGSNIGSVFNTVFGVLTNRASITTMFIWTFIVAGTQFILQVSDKFGQGVLWNFITGRYFNPREEERIFMFLDITSSTTIAERIGHTKYFQFISEFFADVTDPIIENMGEIYQYVGDEVIVSWKTGSQLSNANCIRCFYDIVDQISGLRSKYETKFGVIPQFKAGIHSGKATIGEIGVVKKDIAFSGDVLNTTERILGECHRYNSILLISTKLLNSLELGEEFQSKTLDKIKLKGKENSVELNAIDRITIND